MAKLDDNGNLDFGLDQFTPNPAPRPQGQIDPVTGLPINPTKVSITDPPPMDPVASGSSGYPSPSPSPSAGGAPLPDPSGFNVKPTQPSGTTDATNYTSVSQIGSPNYIDAMIADYGGRSGVNPSVTNDPGYWKNAIAAHGGIHTQDDVDYWASRMMQPEGPAEGGAPSPTSGGGNPGSNPTTENSGLSSGLTSFLLNWLSRGNPGTTNARSSLIQRLLDQADSLSKPVSADDPIIRASSDAYHGTNQRQLADYRSAAAARASAEGVGSGAFDSQINNAENTAGMNEANFTTSLMNTELQNRRSQLVNVLQQAGGQISAQDAADIQSKIAAIDGMIKQQGANTTATGVGNSFTLGEDSLALQKALGLSALDLQRLGLTNQNSQFYDKLGEDSAFNAAQLDYLYQALGLKK